MLGLDIYMGAVMMRDTAADADTAHGEGLPVYQTAAACQAALRQAIQKHADRSHAEGNYGRFACVDWRTWATSARKRGLVRANQALFAPHPPTPDCPDQAVQSPPTLCEISIAEPEQMRRGHNHTTTRFPLQQLALALQ